MKSIHHSFNIGEWIMMSLCPIFGPNFRLLQTPPPVHHQLPLALLERRFLGVLDAENAVMKFIHHSFNIGEWSNDEFCVPFWSQFSIFANTTTSTPPTIISSA